MSTTTQKLSENVVDDVISSSNVIDTRVVTSDATASNGVDHVTDLLSTQQQQSSDDSVSVDRPTVAQQLAVATSLANDDSSTHAYAVSRAWLRRWKDHVTSALAAPGPVEMDARHAGGSDTNDYIPEVLWRHLVEWYGLSAAHQLDRKHKAVTFNDEISFEICTLSAYSGIVDHVTRTFNRFEEVGYVEFQLCRIFSVIPSSSSLTRLWISERERIPPSFRLLSNRSRMLKDFVERDRTYILALEERKSVSSWWPTGETGLARGDLCKYSNLLVPTNNSHSQIKHNNDWTNVSDLVSTQLSDVTRTSLDKLLASFSQVSTQQLAQSQGHVTQLTNQVRRQRCELASRERALDERRRRVAEVESRLANDRKQFAAQSADLEARRAAVNRQQQLVDSVRNVQLTRVRLDVGGSTFVTSRTTLVDRDQHSLLAALFSNDVTPLKPETDGSYFIDRDGMHFRFVVEYLRNGNESVLPADVGELRHVLCEAKYFRLRHLVKRIEDRLTELNASIV